MGRKRERLKSDCQENCQENSEWRVKRLLHSPKFCSVQVGPQYYRTGIVYCYCQWPLHKPKHLNTCNLINLISSLSSFEMGTTSKVYSIQEGLVYLSPLSHEGSYSHPQALECLSVQFCSCYSSVKCAQIDPI